MIPYLLIASVAYTGGAVSALGRRTGPANLAVLYIFGLALVMFIGLRFEVGKDWLQYLHIFETISRVPLEEGLLITDPGYSFINILSSRAGLGITAVNMICATILVTGIVMFAVQTPYPWLAMAVALPHIVTVMSMDHVRQSTALGFILIALAGLWRQRVGEFIIFALLAFFFHRTSLLVAALGLIVISRNKILIASVMALAVAAIGEEIWSTRLEIYFSRYIESGMGSRGALLRVVPGALLAAAFLFLRKRFILPEKFGKLMVFLAWGAIIMAVLLPFSPSAAAIDRLSKYFLPVQLLVYPLLVALVRGYAWRSLFAIILVTFLAFSQIYWLQNSQLASNFWIPYKHVDF